MDSNPGKVRDEQARYDERRINALWLIVVVAVAMGVGLMMFAGDGGNPRTGTADATPPRSSAAN